MEKQPNKSDSKAKNSPVKEPTTKSTDKVKSVNEKEYEFSVGKEFLFYVKENPSTKRMVQVDDQECMFSEERTEGFLFGLFSIGCANADDWILDSGATRDVCSNESYFETLDMSYKSSVEVANGQFLPVLELDQSR